MVLFFWQDKRPRHWYPVPGGRRRTAQDEKERIERLRSCLNDMTQRQHSLATDSCHISEQCLAVCSQAETLTLILLPRGRGPLLLCATITPSGQKLFNLRTERQLPACPSLAQLTEFGVGRGQQGGSQGCVWEGTNEAAPWPCPCRELH